LRYQSGGALRALAMYRKSTGRRDRLSIDLGTESMPELGPGTNAVLRLCVRRHGRLLGQHLRELVRGIAEQGSDHHRDNEQDQGSAMGRRPARRMAGAARVRHKRSVTVDVGRYHGQQIAHLHPRWRGRLSVWSRGEYYPACGQFYGPPQFKYYKIRWFTPARLTWVGANRLEASVQGPWTS